MLKANLLIGDRFVKQLRPTMSDSASRGGNQENDSSEAKSVFVSTTVISNRGRLCDLLRRSTGPSQGLQSRLLAPGRVPVCSWTNGACASGNPWVTSVAISAPNVLICDETNKTRMFQQHAGSMFVRFARISQGSRKASSWLIVLQLSGCS